MYIYIHTYIHIYIYIYIYTLVKYIHRNIDRLQYTYVWLYIIYIYVYIYIYMCIQTFELATPYSAAEWSTWLARSIIKYNNFARALLGMCQGDQLSSCKTFQSTHHWSWFRRPKHLKTLVKINTNTQIRAWNQLIPLNILRYRSTANIPLKVFLWFLAKTN